MQSVRRGRVFCNLVSWMIFSKALWGGEPSVSHFLRLALPSRTPCSHLLKTLLLGNSWRFTTCFVIESHFSFRMSASPSQVSMLHQKWFVIDGTHWLNFSHPFFLDDAYNILVTFLIACHGSIWCFLSFCSSLIYFFIWGCESVETPATCTPASSIKFRVSINPFFSMAFEFFTSHTETTLKSTSNIVYVPYFALWPGESQRPSPARVTGSTLSLSVFNSLVCFFFPNVCQ